MVSLTEKYRPRKIADFAGLRVAKAFMGKLAKSPWESSWLFVGRPGTGKTAMAFAVAEAIGGQIHHIPSSQCDKATVERLVMDCQQMPMFGGEWHIVVCDECDQMTTAAQNAFLSLLDGSGHWPKRTIFLFTCNQTGKLEERFLSRNRVIQFDDTVDAAELGSFLYDVWWAEAPPSAPAPLMHKIIAESKLNTRSALMAIEMELLLLPAERRVA